MHPSVLPSCLKTVREFRGYLGWVVCDKKVGSSLLRGLGHLKKVEVRNPRRFLGPDL